MSIKAMNYVWDNSCQKGAGLLLMLAIADMADEAGDCFASHGYLAKRTRTNKEYVPDLIKQCEQSGELVVFQGMGKKTVNGWTNRYRIVLPDKELTYNGAEPRPTPPDRGDKSTPLENSPQTEGSGIPHTGGSEYRVEPSVEPSVEPILSATEVAGAATPPAEQTQGQKEESTPSTLQQSLFALETQSDDIPPTAPSKLPDSTSPKKKVTKKTESPKRLFTNAAKDELLPIFFRYSFRLDYKTMTPAEVTAQMKRFGTTLSALQPLDDEKNITATELEAAYKHFRRTYKDATYPAGADTLPTMLVDYRAHCRVTQPNGGAKIGIRPPTYENDPFGNHQREESSPF
jgi:hypothetical protein